MNACAVTIVFLAALSTSHCQTTNATKSCSEVHNGICMLLRECDSAEWLLKRNYHEVLKKMTCGWDGPEPLVCCANETKDYSDFIFNETSTALPSTEKTDVSRTTGRPPVNLNVVYPSRPLPPQSQSVDPATQPRVRTTTQKPTTQDENNDGEAYYNVYDNLPVHIDRISVDSTTERQKYPLLPSRNVCGHTANLMDKIFGGVPTGLSEFPWTAVLKVRKPTGAITFGCMATLLNQYYVITAAHCVHNVDVIAVRFGEWDFETERDCIDGVCNDPPVDVPIEHTVVHSSYTRRNISYDIALIRLTTPLNYSNFIRPICLPTSDYVATQDYLNDIAYKTSGWGATELGLSSVVLRKINVKAVDVNICGMSFKQLSPDQLQKVICAGGRRGEDTCAGDSGGGLIREVTEDSKTNWFLYGVTSFGARQCGTEGVPSVYTRITAYLDWITANILP